MATGQAPAVLNVTVQTASDSVSRVVEAVYDSLDRLMRADNLQLDFVRAARPFFTGKDEAAELQVVLLSPRGAFCEHTKQANGSCQDCHGWLAGQHQLCASLPVALPSRALAVQMHRGLQELCRCA